MTVVLLLGAAAAVAGYWIVRRRRDEPPREFRFCCPRCGQKIRYGAEGQARRIMYPRCLRVCTLPGAKEAG
jgi:hypothetical protein